MWTRARCDPWSIAQPDADWGILLQSVNMPKSEAAVTNATFKFSCYKTCRHVTDEMRETWYLPQLTSCHLTHLFTTRDDSSSFLREIHKVLLSARISSCSGTWLAGMVRKSVTRLNCNLKPVICMIQRLVRRFQGFPGFHFSHGVMWNFIKSESWFCPYVMIKLFSAL
jgi:hypothetical protein